MGAFKIGRKAALVLMAGDLVAILMALFLSMVIRNGTIPIMHTWLIILLVFLPVFCMWLVLFFIYNFYGRVTVSTSRNLPIVLFQAMVFNMLIAIVFFYAFPTHGITPKTTLIILSGSSYLLVYAWRAYLFPLLSRRHKESVMIIGRNPEHEEILQELTSHPSFDIVATVSDGTNSDELKQEIKRTRAKVIIADMRSQKSEALFRSFKPEEILKLRFVNPAWLYENLFGRIPLSHVTNTWLFTHITYEQRIYDAIKRVMDIIVAGILGLLSLVLYPFVAVAIKLEDGGDVFIRQLRIGRDMRTVRIIKFRSMTGNDDGKYEGGRSKLLPTRVGAFLRSSRIDELPQLWNVLKGDLSLVGPRPELIPLTEYYAQEIPFYHVRHLIAPGLAGWAQIHQIADSTDPHHSTAVDATKEKLSYDFYYLKHRSPVLDLMVLLKTIRIILSRKGS